MLVAVLFYIAQVCSVLPDELLSAMFTYTDDHVKNLYSGYQEYLAKGENDILDTYIELNQLSEEVKHNNIIAVDVGGTSLKLGYFDSEYKEDMMKQVVIPKDESYKRMSIFTWIAQEINFWLNENNLNKNDAYDIALTFSYPVKLTSLGTGSIQGFTKDFAFADVEVGNENDPGKMLNKELSSIGLNMTTKVILNDTTATFVAAKEKKVGCNLGVVLGTGTNGAFVKNGKLYNSEWGGKFNTPAIYKNEYDFIIEYYTKTKFFACIDSMIGGLKFVEMINLILNKYDGSELLKKYYNPDNIEEPYYKVIKLLKERVFTILAILTVASVEGNIYNVSINGSGLASEMDQKLYKEKIQAVHNLVKESEFGSAELIFVEEASLKGAIYALRYNGKL